MRLPDERHAESQPVSSHKNNKSSFPLGVEFSCCISRALRHVSKAEKVQDHSYIVCSTWQLVGFHLHHALLKWALSHSLQQRLSFLHRQDEILQWHTLRSAVQIRSAAVHWEKSSDTSNFTFHQWWCHKWHAREKKMDVGFTQRIWEKSFDTGLQRSEMFITKYFILLSPLFPWNIK